MNTEITINNRGDIRLLWETHLLPIFKSLKAKKVECTYWKNELYIEFNIVQVSGRYSPFNITLDFDDYVMFVNSGLDEYGQFSTHEDLKNLITHYLTHLKHIYG